MLKPIGLCVIGAGAIAQRHMQAYEKLGGIAPRWVVSRPAEAARAFAQRWGFAHTGRFAVLYRQTYGQSPHTTLRQQAAPS